MREEPCGDWRVEWRQLCATRGSGLQRQVTSRVLSANSQTNAIYGIYIYQIYSGLLHYVTLHPSLVEFSKENFQQMPNTKHFLPVTVQVIQGVLFLLVRTENDP